MVTKVAEIALHLDEILAEKLQLLYPQIGEYRILRKSLDARRGHAPKFLYKIAMPEPNHAFSSPDFCLVKVKEKITRALPKPIIVGAGPAGLFAALRLVERGIPTIIVEQGAPIAERVHDVAKFWRKGVLNPHSNVCFGEGGAGLYSDGKLLTRKRSPHTEYVFRKLVQFGAPEEILFLAQPHIGSNLMRKIVPNIRQYLINNGCKILFNTKFTQLYLQGEGKIGGIITASGERINSSQVILAVGHSAYSTFEHLHSLGVALTGKSFAIGLRIEHPQNYLNKMQYREYADHPALPPASYRLTHHDHKNNLGVYSFCMCPGGYIISCSSEDGTTVCNGMSNYQRRNEYGNSAIVVTIDYAKIFGDKPMSGLEFRHQLEKQTYQLTALHNNRVLLPSQSVEDFLSHRLTSKVRMNSAVPGSKSARIDTVLPDFIYRPLCEGLVKFDKKMAGFINEDATLFAIESRTSCPVRIERNPETMASISHAGLYPIGEGAGYAGGITSSSCDGISVAEQIYAQYA